MFRDFWLAGRRLAATPLFLLFAVASISIGIATTTAAYSILYAFMWKPMGIGDPKDVVVATVGGAAGPWRYAFSEADFETLIARQESFGSLAAVLHTPRTLTTASASEVTSFEAVTGDFFGTIRVRAALGRVLQPADDERQAEVVVLGDTVWRRRFAADPDVVGKTVKIGGKPFEIVGVAPGGFAGLTARVVPVAGWVPLSAARMVARPAGLGAAPPRNERERRHLAVVGRLKRGENVAAAAAALATIGASLDARETVAPDRSRVPLPRQWSLRSITLADHNPQQSNFGILLLILIGLVLVVACTNLGNLTLSRGAYRQHELAVRRALGASRSRLVRELCSETILIAALAALCTTALTVTLLAFATREITTPLGALSIEPRLNLAAAAVATGALLLSMIIFGVEPAFALTRRRTAMSLADGNSTIGAGRSSRQRAFIRWQVATSACFFLIAATLVRTIAVQVTHDSGIALDQLAMASVHSSAGATPDRRIRESLERAATLVRQRGDIDSVAVSTGLPFGFSWTPLATMTVPDRPPVSGPRPTTWMIAAGPEIFRTLGIPIVRGRAFDERDTASSSHVAVMSERTALETFGTVEAVGRSITLQEFAKAPRVTYSIVGVARQTDSGQFMQRRDEVVYVPLTETQAPNFVLVARTSGSLAAAGKVLQDALRATDPDLGTGMVGPASWFVAGRYVVGRIAAVLAGTLGALTLILAMIGLYGVQAQAVVFRTRELGVRMALGAAAQQIQRMVLGEGVRPVAEGLVLGLLVGAFARWTIKALLDAPIQVVDPIAFSAVPIPLAIAALAACYLPARRAARVEPTVALRHL
jgi:predicted permease